MNYSGYAYIYTIGCQMNVYDSEKLASILKLLGDVLPKKANSGQLVKSLNTAQMRKRISDRATQSYARISMFS